MKYAFQELGFAKIYSYMKYTNKASARVAVKDGMQKCGLKYEGTLRKEDWNNQGIVDASMYGLLAEEYDA